MVVKILGTGCPKCKILEEKVRKIARENQIDVDIIKVTNINDILAYGIMMTPGLVVDEQVKSSGALPSDEKILEWLH